MDPKLDPEHGGGGVESSQIGYTKEEAKANWEAFKANIDGTKVKVEEGFRALWDKVKVMVEALIAKLPV